MMEIFDTHTHLNVENFAGQEAQEIALARELGVTRMNIVGFDPPSSGVWSSQPSFLSSIRLSVGTRPKLVLTTKRLKT